MFIAKECYVSGTRVGLTYAAIGANERLAALLAGRRLRRRSGGNDQAKRHHQMGQA